MFWYVLYTKPKREKKIVAQLQNIGINVYCPMITTVKQWSDRKKKVEESLISSCIFVKIDEADRNNVFQVSGVVRYLFYLGKPAKVRDSEIEILKKYLQIGLLDTKVETLEKGDLYTITSGPFEGKGGVVEEVGKNRLQLKLIELGLKITIAKEFKK